MQIQSHPVSLSSQETNPGYLLVEETGLALNKILYRDLPKSVLSLLTLDLPKFAESGEDIAKDATRLVWNITHAEERAKEIEARIHAARQRAQKRRGRARQ
jgi:ABC-type Fe3+-hydroxamate transport system substrate-binding protein